MGKQTQSKEKKQHMASPTDGSKPTGHGFSKKKKPKPNLKTDGSKN